MMTSLMNCCRCRGNVAKNLKCCLRYIYEKYFRARGGWQKNQKTAGQLGGAMITLICQMALMTVGGWRGSAEPATTWVYWFLIKNAKIRAVGEKPTKQRVRVKKKEKKAGARWRKQQGKTQSARHKVSFC